LQLSPALPVQLRIVCFKIVDQKNLSIANKNYSLLFAF
jgi:hypothetical protein